MVAGVIVGGIAVYLIYRATHEDGHPAVQAPPANPGPPVTEPHSGPRVTLPPAASPPVGPIVDPAPGPSGPVSLPGAPHDGPVRASGDPSDRRGNVERLEQLDREGAYTGSDPVNLRERLMSDHPDVRERAERELRSLEAAAQAMRRPAPAEPEPEPEPAPVSRPFTRDAAFDALMQRLRRPGSLGQPPFAGHPRQDFEPVGWEDENSDVPGQLRKVLVIRGLRGNIRGERLRFSVAWDEATGQYEDIHEASR
ncbi:hypothetical protein OJ962_34175 [Solirubrobacter sp. CPCC 204708]|uniref:Uncharacterized protein n=1 Tax=Solirubrobacter deserti TaxID=2282478 RepID=A0ABT4RVH8_9ACTN|nr:hypothetical protein [Solirubrobacter deserti]